MAGGPHAAVMCCMKCGRRAERRDEGAENDTYECSAGHRYSVHWKQIPKSPQWPPTAEERANLEIAARALGWDLAAIDAEIAKWAPPPARPAPRSVAHAPRPQQPPRAAPPAPSPPPGHSVPDAHEWLERELRQMAAGWSNAKTNHAGDDWEDFAHYKANERYSDELVRRFLALEVKRFARVAELADALDALSEQVRGDADYGSAQASIDATRALAERIRGG